MLQPVSSQLSSPTRGRLDKFHHESLLYRDVCDANVLIGEDGWRLLLLGFDWARKAGTICYLRCLNLAGRRDGFAMDI